MRFLELTLYALDVEELRRFYVGILGLRQIEPYWSGRLAVQAGDTHLFFLPAGQILGQAGSPAATPLRPGVLDPGGIRPRYHFALDVPVDRFDLALDWLGQRGGLISSISGQTRFFHDNIQADAVYFSDPQGNVLELIGRRELPHDEAANRTSAGDAARQMARRPFNASEIIAVTEIGLAADSVAGAAGALAERMPGLELYQGAGSDSFTMLGDIHGTIIIVRRGRIWFPDTGVPADFLPLDALVEIQSGQDTQQRYRLVTPPYPFQVTPV